MNIFVFYDLRLLQAVMLPNITCHVYHMAHNRFCYVFIESFQSVSPSLVYDFLELFVCVSILFEFILNFEFCHRSPKGVDR